MERVVSLLLICACAVSSSPNQQSTEWICPEIHLPAVNSSASVTIRPSANVSMAPLSSWPTADGNTSTVAPVSCVCEMIHTLRCDGQIDLSRRDTRVFLQKLLNNLRNLPEHRSVTLLDISIKNIQFIPQKLFQDVDIRGLVISTGNLNQINTKSFTGLEYMLTALGLPGNAIKSVPSSELSILKGLMRLDLSGNKLKGIHTLPNLTNLEYLDLSRNEIFVVAAGVFQSIPNLKLLSLSENRLDLDSLRLYNLQHLSYLSSIDLSSNRIVGNLRRPVLDLFPSNLKILDLSFNKLSGLGERAFKNLGSLSTLLIQSNNLQEIMDEAFVGLSRLQRLDLSHNSILTLSDDSFLGLTSLRVLSLSHNHLQVLSGGWLSGLTALRQLELLDNEITTVEEYALNNTSITMLSMAGNPLNCDCSLNYFQAWLIRRRGLQHLAGSGGSATDTPRCATPAHLTNAPVVNVEHPLECLNSSEVEYYEYYTEPGLVSFVRQSYIHLTAATVNRSSGYLTLEWKVEEEVRPFTCGEIHILQEKETGVDHIAESKLLCSDKDLMSKEVLNTSISFKENQLHMDTPYIFCVTLDHESILYPGCTGSLSLKSSSGDLSTNTFSKSNNPLPPSINTDDLTAVASLSPPLFEDNQLPVEESQHRRQQQKQQQDLVFHPLESQVYLDIDANLSTITTGTTGQDTTATSRNGQVLTVWPRVRVPAGLADVCSLYVSVGAPTRHGGLGVTTTGQNENVEGKGVVDEEGENEEELLLQRTTRCSVELLKFPELPPWPVYRVCAALQVEDRSFTDVEMRKLVDKSGQCLLILQPRVRYQDKSILPLLLTLVFLALGIACLTVLYLIIKRSREDNNVIPGRSKRPSPISTCLRKLRSALFNTVQYTRGGDHRFLQQSDMDNF